MKRSQGAVCAALAGLVLFLGGAAIKADAQTMRYIAVYGDNRTDDLINLMNPPVSPGETFGLTNYRAELVSTADIIAGALERTNNPFSAFFYTGPERARPDSLSGVAYDKVRDFVRRSNGNLGSIVLFNGDFAEALSADLPSGGTIGDPVVMRLFANAVIYAAASGHGFIGEHLGALAALTTNQDDMSSFNFVAGDAAEFVDAVFDPRGGGAGGSLRVGTHPDRAGHPLLAGVNLPYNPTPGTVNSQEKGAYIRNVDPRLVVAGYSGILIDADGRPVLDANRNTIPYFNPAIIVQPAQTGEIPEPSSLALLGTGLLGMGGYLRRRRAH